MLKGCYLKYKNDFPPRSHDLVKLADMAGIQMDEELVEFLDAVNTFNISTRYPDEKFKFLQVVYKRVYSKQFLTNKEDSGMALTKNIS